MSRRMAELSGHTSALPIAIASDEPIVRKRLMPGLPKHIAEDPDKEEKFLRKRNWIRNPSGVGDKYIHIDDIPAKVDEPEETPQ